MGVAGAGSLAQVVNAALNNRERFRDMQAFFAGVGSGDTAGIWQEQPQEHTEFRDQMRRRRERQLATRNVEDAI